MKYLMIVDIYSFTQSINQSCKERGSKLKKATEAWPICEVAEALSQSHSNK